MQNWVRLPTGWVEDGGLKGLRWAEGEGASNAAALLAPIAIAQHADQETGLARLTYDDLGEATHLSRAKLSDGLDVLGGRGLILRQPDGRSSYALTDFDTERGWGKLPARGLYGEGRSMGSFRDFTLRKPAELNALKLYLLFVARRNRETNMADLSYDKIVSYSGVARERIKAALNVLAANGLVHIEHVPSTTNDFGSANAYRLAHLESRVHMGTRGRRFDADDFA